MALDLSVLDVESLPSAAHDSSARGVARAPLAAFVEDPHNPRFEHDAASFEALVADVRERGILQPIVVRRLPDDRLGIRFGSRRFRAAKLAGLVEMPYTLTEDPRQFDDYAQVAENEQRASLQPLELATFIAKKLNQGETKRVVARQLRLDPSAVTHLLALVGDVPGFVLELYHSRKCRSPQYLYELRRLSMGRADEIEKRCALALEIDRKFILSLSDSEETSGARSPKAVRPNQTSKSLDAAAATAGVGSAVVAPTHPIGEDTSPSACGAGEGSATRPNVQFSRPCLIVHYEGNKCRVDLLTRPGKADMIVLRFGDGRREEVSIAAVQLLRLCEEGEAATFFAS